MPGSALLFPALTDRKHLFLASFRTDFLGSRAVCNGDLKGSMSLTQEGSCVPGWQRLLSGAGTPCREPGREVELWACPCSLCGLLHSVAFRAQGLFELRAERAARSPRTAGISSARSPCPPSGVFPKAGRTQMMLCAPGKLATEPRAAGTALAV